MAYRSALMESTPQSHSIEYLLSECLAVLGGERFVVLQDSILPHYIESSSILRWEGPGEAIAFDFAHLFRNTFQLHERIWDVQRVWESSPFLQNFRLVEKWRCVCPLFYRTFQVYRLSKTPSRVGHVIAAECLQETFPLKNEKQQREIQSQFLRVSLPIQVQIAEESIKDGTNLGFQVSAKLHPQGLGMSCTCLGLLQCVRGKARFQVTKKEDQMEESLEEGQTLSPLQEDSVVMSIQLGEIELSLSDLMSLRPGSIIHINHNEALEGVLCLGQSKIIDVALEMGESEFSLKVKGYHAPEVP